MGLLDDIKDALTNPQDELTGLKTLDKILLFGVGAIASIIVTIVGVTGVKERSPVKEIWASDQLEGARRGMRIFKKLWLPLNPIIRNYAIKQNKPRIESFRYFTQQAANFLDELFDDDDMEELFNM